MNWKNTKYISPISPGNYAHGDESLEEIYGYEPWRQQKLQDLKKAYDPLGRFNFYAPITW